MNSHLMVAVRKVLHTAEDLNDKCITVLKTWYAEDADNMVTELATAIREHQDNRMAHHCHTNRNIVVIPLNS